MKRLALAACVALAAYVALAARFVEAATAEVVVMSYCPPTRASGIGRGATYDAAKAAAIQACLANGGKMVCCAKLIRRIS